MTWCKHQLQSCLPLSPLELQSRFLCFRICFFTIFLRNYKEIPYIYLSCFCNVCCKCASHSSHNLRSFYLSALGLFCRNNTNVESSHLTEVTVSVVNVYSWFSTTLVLAILAVCKRECSTRTECRLAGNNML